MSQGRRVCSWSWIPHVYWETCDYSWPKNNTSFLSQYNVNKCWIVVPLIRNTKNTMFTSEKYSDPSHTHNLSLINYQLLASFIYTSSHFPLRLLPQLDYFKANPGYLTSGWLSKDFFSRTLLFFLINLLFWKHFRFTQNLQR